ncbi:hypothetical protein GWI33_015440 [Rhynchophorus ferrugineus]|uniref:Uncharacterized protein n=1 Tax=Rhynchophorus ferrugineus TaxID=354439 RepID=A0A834I3C3_RHYFE|nr:hypothetical protein GWI33_015440 [Rhynchophorus ferrugineus]
MSNSSSVVNSNLRSGIMSRESSPVRNRKRILFLEEDPNYRDFCVQLWIPLAAGLFNRDVYIEGLKRRAETLSKRKGTSTVCSLQ